MISKNPTCIVNWQTSMALPAIAQRHSRLSRRRAPRASQPAHRCRFPDHVLLELLSDFETRNDINIRRLVTDNADVPTIFEYIVGIVWYKISNRKGRILDYFNLSLDADLLPKTHAAGGMEDITYRYNATPDYPDHTLLIEATLARGPTHNAAWRWNGLPALGDFSYSNNRQEAYALFVTPFLHLNVISDFGGENKALLFKRWRAVH